MNLTILTYIYISFIVYKKMAVQKPKFILCSDMRSIWRWAVWRESYLHVCASQFQWPSISGGKRILTYFRKSALKKIYLIYKRWICNTRVYMFMFLCDERFFKVHTVNICLYILVDYGTLHCINLFAHFAFKTIRNTPFSVDNWHLQTRVPRSKSKNVKQI